MFCLAIDGRRPSLFISYRCAMRSFLPVVFKSDRFASTTRFGNAPLLEKLINGLVWPGPNDVLGPLLDRLRVMFAIPQSLLR